MRLQKLNVIALNTETHLLTRPSSQSSTSAANYSNYSLVNCVQHCPAGKERSGVHVKVTQLLF